MIAGLTARAISHVALPQKELIGLTDSSQELHYLLLGNMLVLSSETVAFKDDSILLNRMANGTCSSHPQRTLRWVYGHRRCLR